MVNSVRIADLPDLGVLTDTSRIVGEHAGSGTYTAAAIADYIRLGQSGSALGDAIAAVAAALTAETSRAVVAETQQEPGVAVLAWSASAGAVVVNGTYLMVLAWPWSGGTLTGVVASAATGSFSVAITVGGIAVPGLSSINVNSPTPATTTAGSNAMHAGDRVAAVVTASAGSPADVALQLNFTRPKA